MMTITFDESCTTSYDFFFEPLYVDSILYTFIFGLFIQYCVELGENQEMGFHIGAS